MAMSATGDLRQKRNEVLEQLQRVAPVGRDGKTHVLEPAAIKWVLRRLDGKKWTPDRINFLLERVDRDQDGKIVCEKFVDAIYYPNDARHASSGQADAEIQLKNNQLESMARSNMALQQELRTLRGQVTDVVQKEAKTGAELQAAREQAARFQEELGKAQASEQEAREQLKRVPLTLPELGSPLHKAQVQAQQVCETKKVAELMGSVLFSLSKMNISNASDAFRYFAGGTDTREVPVQAFLQKLAVLGALSPDECEQLVAHLDGERHGTIKFRPFRSAMANFLSQSNEIHRILPDDQYNALLVRIQIQITDRGFTLEDVFKECELDENGYLGCRGFVTGLKSLQIGLAEKELVQLFDALVHRIVKGRTCCRANPKAQQGRQSGPAGALLPLGVSPVASPRPSESVDASPNGRSRSVGYSSGAQRLSIADFARALTKQTAAQSKLRDWAAHNFASLSQVSMQVLAQKHAEPPDYQRLEFVGFKALMNELNPDMKSDEVSRLWLLMSKDDESKEPAVRVEEFSQVLQMPRPGETVDASQSGYLTPASAMNTGGSVRRGRGAALQRSNSPMIPEQKMRFGMFWGGFTPTTASPAISLQGSPAASPRRGSSKDGSQAGTTATGTGTGRAGRSFSRSPSATRSTGTRRSFSPQPTLTGTLPPRP